MNTFYRFLNIFGIGIILVFLCIYFSMQSDVFFTADNIRSIFIQSLLIIIIATGMTFVICAAEIDLSVGSLLGLCGMLTAFILQTDPETGLNLPMRIANTVVSPLPDLLPGAVTWWLAAGGSFLILALLPGIIAGAVSGSIVVYFAIPSFIVTLGFMLIYRGLARYVTNAQVITGLPVSFLLVDSGSVAGGWFTPSMLIAFITAIVGIILLNYTRFGRNVLATGGNQQASYLSGVPVNRTRFLVFVVSGACVGMASIVQTSRLFIGDPNAGEGYELDAIAAVIIGGTSLFGGVGSVMGTVFGALIIGVLRNGLVLMDVTDHIKQIVIGFIIIFAVLLDYARRRLASVV